MAGRHINDMGGKPHTSDMMMKSSNNVKHYSSDGHSGGIKDYPDTSEHIEKDQSAGNKHIKARPMKDGYRY